MAGFDASQLLSVAAFAGAGVFAHAALRSARADRATHESAVFLLLAGTAFVMALRQAVGDFAPPAIDAALYQALHVPAAMSMVVLMHLTALRLTRSDAVSLVATGLFTVLAAACVAQVFAADFSQSTPREWMAANESAAAGLFGLFTFPALTAAGLLVFAARDLRPDLAQRLRLASLACAVFYLAFTVDAVDPRAVGQLLLSVLLVASAGLAHVASFPKAWLDLVDPAASRRAAAPVDRQG